MNRPAGAICVPRVKKRPPGFGDPPVPKKRPDSQALPSLAPAVAMVYETP